MSGLVLGSKAITSMAVAVFDVLFSLLMLQVNVFITKIKNKEMSAKWSISLRLRLMVAWWESCPHSRLSTGRAPVFPTSWSVVSLFPHPPPQPCVGSPDPDAFTGPGSTAPTVPRVLVRPASWKLVPVVWGLFQQNLHLSPGQRLSADPWLWV